MSVTGSRAAAEINLDEFERRLRAAGAQSAGSEDHLFELARRVESSRPAAASAAPPLGAAGEQPMPPETVALRPAFDEPADDQSETAEVEAPQVAAFQDFDENDLGRAEQPVGGRSGGWTLKVTALAVAGVAMIGAVFMLRGGVPGLPKQPPYIVAAQDPTKVLPPSDDTVAASNDAGASFLKDNAQSAHEVVASAEQPVDLNALASTGPAPADASDPPVDASGGTTARGTVDTPVVVTTAAPPPPIASQFPDPKPVGTVSLRPDGTPIPSPITASADAGGAAPAAEAPVPHVKPAPKATNEQAAMAQPSTPKLDLPTKLSGKSSARVVVAKTDTTAPGNAAETPSKPLQLVAPKKPEKAAKAPPVAQAAAETPAAPAAPAAQAASAQQPGNPLLHAFGSLVGALAAPNVPAAPTQHPVDPTAVTASTGWAVQLAAPKSEADANSDASRLNAKYASALNGSTIGVHKVVVNGDTIYRLRVAGLSKAEAAALCARLKGDGGQCFIAK